MNDNRRKLTGILKLLYENTDAEHSMDTYQIMDALESMGHGRPDRKTIDANIKFIINDLGFGIKKEKGKPNRYRWVEREFDLAELKMLVDAVHSSHFITQRKSREIITKLKDLTSVHQAATLNREMYTSSNFKHDGTDALINADIVNEAIKAKHRVKFQMADHDMDKREVLREDGKIYEVSPYALLWNNDYYYMIGLRADSGTIDTYRIDKMKNTEADYTDAEPAPHDFSLERYERRVFDMFIGNSAEIELTCKAYTMDYLIDKFGKNFYSERLDSSTFKAKVNAEAGPSFYSWVFGFAGDIRIESPSWVRDQYSNMLRTQLR